MGASRKSATRAIALMLGRELRGGRRRPRTEVHDAIDEVFVEAALERTSECRPPPGGVIRCGGAPAPQQHPPAMQPAARR